MGQRRGDKGWLEWSVKMRAGTVSKNDFSVIALYDREHGTFVFYCSTILVIVFMLYNVQCTGHVFSLFSCVNVPENSSTAFFGFFHSVQNFVLSEHSVIGARSPQAPKQVTARIPIV